MSSEGQQRKAWTAEQIAAYKQAKRAACSDDVSVRRQLAHQADVRPEILYYLAEDEDVEVRKLIAGNSATPRQADAKLAHDRDEGVRADLAQKISAQVPELAGADPGNELALDILGTLARDEAVRVRQVVAETLADKANVPAEIINQLARDVELSVCAPVLEHSPILTEDDLVEIMQAGPVRGAYSAIARRHGLGPRASDGVAASEEYEAVTALLGNASAQIREETLDTILQRAPDNPDWHEPLTNRPALPARAAEKLAGFVATNLLQKLMKRTDFDDATARAIASRVQERLGARPRVEAEQPMPARVRPTDKVRILAEKGELGEAHITEALAAGDREFVAMALSLMAGTTLDEIDNILQSQAPRAVVALAWRCGLSPRLALQLQLRLARIAPRDALEPRRDGAWPMGDEEMRWQLEFFGIQAPV